MKVVVKKNMLITPKQKKKVILYFFSEVNITRYLRGSQVNRARDGLVNTTTASL